MMRLCYTVATPDTGDTSMLALRQPLGESLALLAHHGYAAAELMVRDPARLDAAEIRRLASDAGLTIPAISTGQLRKEDGLSLCHPDPAIRQQSVDRTMRVIDFAAEFGAQVNIGTLRGHLPAGREPALAAARESFEMILDHAAAVGVRVAVEPQCRYVINWLNTVQEAVDWNAQFGERQPSVLFDLYHAMLEEQSVHAALIRACPFVTWVQFSDTNRRAPGQGHWNFAETLRVLGALGYEGFISIECLQIPDSETALANAAAHLRPLLA
jgi:sugar phosphate isomerase/epimerase